MSEKNPPPGMVSRVCGVVVTYHPDITALTQLLELIVPQVETLVIVDNGSDTDLVAIAEKFNVKLQLLGENFGIARAQNVGIKLAGDLGANQVLLLDQDSLPAPDMVEKLTAAAQILLDQGKTVAAVGANYVDPRQGDTGSFVYREGLVLKRRPMKTPNSIVEADFLIASGSLTSIEVFDQVGDMVDELFIDYVDIEWGLRARSMGYFSYGVFNAHMEHALGDDHIPFRGHRVPLHGALRHYYQLRNAVWLARRSWIPRVWTLLLVWRMFRQFLFFSVAAPKGLTHSRMMTAGILDGLRGRMGRK
ncbi:MAG: glycosyltransferase family 2 protein [Hyphomicrobiales bacterium]